MKTFFADPENARVAVWVLVRVTWSRPPLPWYHWPSFGTITRSVYVPGLKTILAFARALLIAVRTAGMPMLSETVTVLVVVGSGGAASSTPAETVTSAEVAEAEPCELVPVTRTASDGCKAAPSAAIGVYVCAFTGLVSVMFAPFLSHW